MKAVAKACWALAIMLSAWFVYDILARDPASSTDKTTSASTTSAGPATVLPPKEKVPSERATLEETPPEETSTVQEAPVERASASDVAVVMEESFRNDSPGTSATSQRQRELEDLFQAAATEDLGRLTELECRGTICRGEIELRDEYSDREFFSRTLLSFEFGKAIPEAVTVPERQVLEDGRVIATFYIHPPSALDMVPDSPPEGEEG